jgi:hypothetical protein
MFKINLKKIMKNFGFEIREMTFEEKTILEQDIKNSFLWVKWSFIIPLITFIPSFVITFVFAVFIDAEPLMKFFGAICSLTMVILPFGLFTSFFIFFTIRNRKKDVESNETILISVELNTFLNGENDDAIDFYYQKVRAKKWLNFQIKSDTKFNLKGLENPQAFKDIDKTELQTLLQKGKMYSIAFSLKSEYLFSIEEVE